MKQWLWIIASGIVGAATAASLPQDKLLCYYTFDAVNFSGAVLRDNSPQRLDIGASATVRFVSDRFGNPNGAVQMDGSYFFSRLMPDSLVSQIVHGDFTMGFMMNTTAPTGSMDQRFDIMGLGDPYNNGFVLSLNNNRPRIFLGNHGYYDAPDSLNDGKWHFVAAVRSQGTVALYVDGRVADQGAYTDDITPISDSLVIGRHGTKTTSFYVGLIDDAFLYDRGLSSDEISGLYHSLSGIDLAFVPPSDTFSSANAFSVKWHSVKNAIAYAFELSDDSTFAHPFLSVPLDDTSYTAAKALSAGAHFMRFGCNFDDRSAFYFGDPHRIVSTGP
jgi:Concanavalin A-like lectin/glucanases superfamily